MASMMIWCACFFSLGNALLPTLHSKRAINLKLHATQVSAQEVKRLRTESGAGMMDCKKALVEAEGDMEKAAEWLRVKGLASAAKKGERATKEGLIETYIHTGGRLGVMVEVNCETDFVSKGPNFKELCRLLAMQVAASPAVLYVRYEDIPTAIIDKERQVESQSEDLASKPDQIKGKIVEGRVSKFFKEQCLLEQPYIKDPKKTVDEFVKSYIATLGENIQVARFVKFELGGAIDDTDDQVAEPAAVPEPTAVAEPPALPELPAVADPDAIPEPSAVAGQPKTPQMSVAEETPELPIAEDIVAQAAVDDSLAQETVLNEDANTKQQVLEQDVYLSEEVVDEAAFETPIAEEAVEQPVAQDGTVVEQVSEEPETKEVTEEPLAEGDLIIAEEATDEPNAEVEEKIFVEAQPDEPKETEAVGTTA